MGNAIMIERVKRYLTSLLFEVDPRFDLREDEMRGGHCGYDLLI
jgi:hypothetical protein